MRIMKERHFTGTKSPEITEREIKNRALTRKAASEGMVLLENKNHLLPLQKGEKVALYGVGASKTIKGGTGSGDVNERESVSVYQGMKNGMRRREMHGGMIFWSGRQEQRGQRTFLRYTVKRPL